MKSKTSGSVGCSFVNSVEWACAVAWADYVRQRMNGAAGHHTPPSTCTAEVAATKITSLGPDWVRIDFTEGPNTKAFMEAQDRKYLAEIAVNNPILFLKEMTPRSELGQTDQALQLGLDLSLPHHQNLRREFAGEVARVLAERSGAAERESLSMKIEFNCRWIGGENTNHWNRGGSTCVSHSTATNLIITLENDDVNREILAISLSGVARMRQEGSGSQYRSWNEYEGNVVYATYESLNKLLLPAGFNFIEAKSSKSPNSWNSFYVISIPSYSVAADVFTKLHKTTSSSQERSIAKVIHEYMPRVISDITALIPVTASSAESLAKQINSFFSIWETLTSHIEEAEIPVVEGFRAHRAPGDGNCFFHSVAMILGDTDHETLRARAVDYAIGHLDELAGFLDMPPDEFIERMTTPGEWADHVIIRAMAGALTVNFVIHRADGTINELDYSGADARTLHLDYNGVHYDPHVVLVPHAAPVHAEEVPPSSDEPVPAVSREQRMADLMEAIAGGLHENVRMMIATDPTLIMEEDAQGNSLLQFAVIRGRDDIAQYLITFAGIDIHHRNAEGHAAIHLAALHGRLELIKHMMERGVDIDTPNAHGQTPLILAESAGQMEVRGFIAGIKTPSMLRVWGGKYTREGTTPIFVPVAKKEAGSSVGFVSEKEHTKAGTADPRKRWMAKFGLPDAEVTVSETLTSRRRDLQRTVITSIKEKIAADVYTMLGHDAFYVPKHRLAKLPVINDFTSDNELAVVSLQALNRRRTPDEPQITHGVHLMSKWIEGYQDLEHLKNCVIGDTQADFMVFLQQGRIPETVIVDGQAVALIGMMETLATSRLLADTDVLGGGGKNAGFVIERDATGAPMAVRVVKIDAGESFNFSGDNNQFMQSFNPISRSRKLSNKKDIQFGNMQPVVVRWDLLSEGQKSTFIRNLQKGLVYLKEDANLDLLIQRHGQFDKAREDGRPLLQPDMIAEFKAHWLGYIQSQELPEVYGSLLASVEPTPATGPVVAFAPQRFGAANMALVDAKSMGVDV